VLDIKHAAIELKTPDLAAVRYGKPRRLNPGQRSESSGFKDRLGLISLIDARNLLRSEKLKRAPVSKYGSLFRMSCFGRNASTFTVPEPS
jgi:hypothetical protein